MGGPQGIGFGNQPQFINFPNTGNVGNVGNVQPGGTQPNIAPQQDIAPQTTAKMPTRAADVVGQLDVLLMKALNGASGELNAEDLAKSKNPRLLKSLLKSCAMKNVAPPEEIDQQLYDKLMTLAKNAPDGGVARKNYLSSIAQRLGKSSEQYKAAVQRLDESIEYARKLETYGAKIKDKEQKIAAHNGEFVGYSNTFFRDFYEVLIKGSPHEDWFA